MEDELVKDEDGRYPCRFNEGCHCHTLDCYRCGWNPVVAEARLKQLLEKLGVKFDGK